MKIILFQLSILQKYTFSNSFMKHTNSIKTFYEKKYLDEKVLICFVHRNVFSSKRHSLTKIFSTLSTKIIILVVYVSTYKP